jgi:hypothetical protein
LPTQWIPESLADSFAIVASSIPEILVPPSERNRMSLLARRLAPVHRAGFECHLSDPKGHVDLQQCIARGNAEPLRVAAHLRGAGLCEHSGWRRIHDFMLAWSARGPGERIAEFWFEYESAITRGARPSLFLTLDRGASIRDGVRPLCWALPHLLPSKAANRFAAALHNVDHRLPEGTRILDIGLMARRPAILRINVGGGAPGGLADVLVALRWECNEKKRIAEFVRSIEPFALQVKLALDWHEKLLPRAGLEICPADGPEPSTLATAHARWRGLLAWLRARGYCDGRRAAALLDWPGQYEPPDQDSAWPESLMLESLARGPSAFSVISRRLSHLKVDFAPDRRSRLKAYFGFLRQWCGAPSELSQHARVACPGRAIPRGVEYLLRQRSSSGTWRDFRDIRGGSDEWLSAYVAAALAATGLPAARRAAEALWGRLSRLTTGPGWRYNARIPVDADSTLWALRLAAAIDHIGDAPARAALGLLRRHRLGNGGVASFLPANLGDARATYVPVAIAGWCQPHAEVTAAAGTLPGFARSSSRWLLSAQRADGRWNAYWYDEDAFATALAAEHLARQPGSASRHARTRAARWAAARVAPDG